MQVVKCDVCGVEMIGEKACSQLVIPRGDDEPRTVDFCGYACIGKYGIRYARAFGTWEEDEKQPANKTSPDAPYTLYDAARVAEGSLISAAEALETHGDKYLAESAWSARELLKLARRQEK